MVRLVGYFLVYGRGKLNASAAAASTRREMSAHNFANQSIARDLAAEAKLTISQRSFLFGAGTILRS
jgi:hypothetical protein